MEASLKRPVLEARVDAVIARGDPREIRELYDFFKTAVRMIARLLDKVGARDVMSDSEKDWFQQAKACKCLLKRWLDNHRNAQAQVIDIMEARSARRVDLKEARHLSIVA